jgi:hypothetical protein
MRRPGASGLHGIGSMGSPTQVSAATCPSVEQMLGITDPSDPCQVTQSNTSNQVPCAPANFTGPLSPGQVWCATQSTTPPASTVVGGTVIPVTAPSTGISTSTIIMAVAGTAIFAFIFLGNGGKS